MFIAFDCLQLDEGDLRAQALRVRRERLEYVLDRAPAVLLPGAEIWCSTLLPGRGLPVWPRGCLEGSTSGLNEKRSTSRSPKLV
jgi:hypothetical protein